ncbi:MAG: peroxiredoxin family protein [Thiohalomonadaceae bacterium]
MKVKDIAFILIVVALIASLSWLWLSPSGAKPAPDIQLSTLDGQQLNLANKRGRPVLVTFWATTCPGCIKEMPHLIDLYNDYSGRGLEIIGIAMSYDQEQAVRELVRLREVNYPIAHDVSGRAALAFGDIKLTPTTFLIAPNGRIVMHRLGEVDMDALRERIVPMLPPAKATAS